MTSIIANRYRILSELGEGAMGTVYRGLDTQTKQPVAIKRLKTERPTPEMIERFKREGEALRELNHPNIVKMLDAAESDGAHYLVMEYVSGGDLHDFLTSGQLPIERCVKLALDLADALTRAHKLDIIHRDLKPANVLLVEDGTLRLTDFGVARLGQRERLTAAEKVVGTVAYLAPEALHGTEIDSRADIWAFGVMLFEMLAGKHPFSGASVTHTLYAITNQPPPDLEALRPDAPIALIDLIYRMLEKPRDARIRSVRQVGLELEDILYGRSSTRHQTPDVLYRPKYNLPILSTPFVGREAELDEIAKLLDNPKIRWITIVAPGGMGKTRLALEAAQQQIPNFDNGVYFVELAPLSDPAHIVSAVAEAISYQFDKLDGREHKQQVLDFLSNKNLLLVMDNYEHLQDGAAFVTDIVKAALLVKVLVTSRQRLGQAGETLSHLSGMEFPAWETPQDALEYGAVKLFMNSAQRAQPHFELTADNLDDVARICRLVQGMPLGIMLAAAWLAMLTPQEIAVEIQQSMDILTDESGVVGERQQSIRAVFAYSWQMMTASEQSIFMKLSVFRGGFSRDAAQTVTGASLQQLMSLINQSLLRRDNESGRYEIHELLRQYAAEQLHEADESEATQDAHMNYYAELMKECEVDLRGRNQLHGLNAIEVDFENIQNAWLWAVQRKMYQVMEQMRQSIVWFCDIRGYHQEAEGLFQWAREKLAPAVDEEPHPTWNLLLTTWNSLENISKLQLETAIAIAQKHGRRADAPHYLVLLGFISWKNGDWTTYISFIEKALALYRDLGDYEGISNELHRFSGIYALRGNLELAIQYIQQALDITEVGDKYTTALRLDWLGHLMYLSGQYRMSIQYRREALALVREMRSPSSIAFYNVVLGWVYFSQGDFEEVLSLVKESLAIAKDLNNLYVSELSNVLKSMVSSIREDYVTGQEIIETISTRFSDPYMLMEYHHARSLVSCGLGNYVEATQAYQQVLKLGSDIAALPSMLRNLPIRAIILAHEAKKPRAVELLGLAFTHPASPTGWMEKWALLTRLRADLQVELSPETYNAAWERGKALDLKTVVQELLAEFGDEQA